VADADAEIIANLFQRALRAQLARFGASDYLHKAWRLCPSEMQSISVIKRCGASGRSISFPASTVAADTGLSACDDCHMADLADQSADADGAIDFAAEDDADSYACASTNQDEIVSNARIAGVQSLSRFVNCGRDRIIFYDD